MAATSRNLPGTAANDTLGGTVAWVNPSNALTSNDTRATVAFVASAFSQYLKLTNFGFVIPSDARIDGIRAELECRNNAAGTVFTSACRLVIAGTTSSVYGFTTNSADTWSTTEGSLFYGGVRDMAGAALTPAIVNNSGFGIAFQCRKSDAGATSAEVDAAWLTIYYTRQGDNQQTIVRLRAGRPPHAGWIDLPADAIRYGVRRRGPNTASFHVGKNHAEVISGRLMDALTSDPDNPCMITIEAPDGYLPFVGFITEWDDDFADGVIDFRAVDHTVRVADGILPQSGGGSTSSGSLLRQAFQHIDQTWLRLYFDYSDIKDGLGASYAFKLDAGDRILREMENQTGWDFLFASLISPGDVRTLAQWNGPAGTDRTDEEVWQDGVHFTSRSFSTRYRNGLSGVTAVGGSGAFSSRTGRTVGRGQNIGASLGSRREGIQPPGFGGGRALILPQTDNAAVLQKAAQQRLDTPENAVESVRISLLEKAVDRSRLTVGDLRRVRFSSMGKDLEREVKVNGYDLVPGSGVIGVECEVV